MYLMSTFYFCLFHFNTSISTFYSAELSFILFKMHSQRVIDIFLSLHLHFGINIIETDLNLSGSRNNAWKVRPTVLSVEADICRIDVIGRSEGRSAMCIRLRVEIGEKTRGLAAQHGEQTTSDVEDIEIQSKTSLIHSLERLKFDNLQIINMTFGWLGTERAGEMSTLYPFGPSTFFLLLLE